MGAIQTIFGENDLKDLEIHPGENISYNQIIKFREIGSSFNPDVVFSDTEKTLTIFKNYCMQNFSQDFFIEMNNLLLERNCPAFVASAANSDNFVGTLEIDSDAMCKAAASRIKDLNLCVNNRESLRIFKSPQAHQAFKHDYNYVIASCIGILSHTEWKHFRTSISNSEEDCGKIQKLLSGLADRVSRPECKHRVIDLSSRLEEELCRDYVVDDFLREFGD